MLFHFRCDVLSYIVQIFWERLSKLCSSCAEMRHGIEIWLSIGIQLKLNF